MQILPSNALLALIGVAAALVLATLFTALRRKGRRSEDEARAYLAGFTYVLSDDPDAAIAELSRAAQLNTETLETYFALGALFRRKGELDRAVRLHRNILLRPGLTDDIKRRARLELAIDYQRSGLRDQAMETVQKQLQDQPDCKDALRLQRQLLEESSDWEGAAHVQTRLVELEGRGHALLAHLVCEAARRGGPDAEALARRAVSLEEKCADAHLALGEILAGANRHAEAVTPLRRALELEPEVAPRAVKLLAAASQQQVAELDLLLEEKERAAPNPEPYELARAVLLKLRGAHADAIALLRRVVERHPRFWEARRELGTLLLANDRSEELKADYEQILGALGAPMMTFSCVDCRQMLPEFVFRCPSCGGWDGVKRKEAAGLERSRI